MIGLNRILTELDHLGVGDIVGGHLGGRADGKFITDDDDDRFVYGIQSGVVMERA